MACKARGSGNYAAQCTHHYLVVTVIARLLLLQLSSVA